MMYEKKTNHRCTAGTCVASPQVAIFIIDHLLLSIFCCNSYMKVTTYIVNECTKKTNRCLTNIKVLVPTCIDVVFGLSHVK